MTTISESLLNSSAKKSLSTLAFIFNWKSAPVPPALALVFLVEQSKASGVYYDGGIQAPATQELTCPAPTPTTGIVDAESLCPLRERCTFSECMARKYLSLGFVSQEETFLTDAEETTARKG